MHTSRWLRVLAAVALALVAALPARLVAQGITTAAITGTVTDSSNGQPVESAQIQIVNTSTGASVTGQTRPSGVYFLQGLAVGGPYTVTVRRIGFTPQSKDFPNLTLGQRAVLDFKLEPAAATLAAVTVQAGNQVDPVINPNRRGTGTLVNDSILRRAPTLNRNFTDFMSTVPQITTSGPGTSAGGVNNRYNNIQIDGGSANDLFGLGTTGQPGGQSNGKSISLDAVKEYQVLLSPYDLRFANFTGALVNAVTKSGTNELTGDAYYYFRNQNFAANVPFIQNSGLYVEQYGASLGGPIIKDRLHYFVNGEWQARSNPSSGPYIGQAANAASPLTVDSATVQRFITDLTNLGIPAGTGGVQPIPNPLTNAFVRIDLAIPEWNSNFQIRDNYATAALDVFSRTTTFPLTSQDYTIHNQNNSIVGQLNTNFKNGADNELIVGYTKISDHRDPAAGVYPAIVVSVPGLQTATINLLGGAEQFSQGNVLDQKLLEIKDNYSFFAGDEHRITAGFAIDSWSFTNTFTESSYGVWTFISLDSLEAGNANRYRVSKALTNPPSVIANPEGTTYGIYLMDNYTPSPNFNILFGIRVDDPVVSNHPPYTAAFNTVFGPLFASMGRDANTSEVPSGNVQVSPRLGFNWDVTGDNKNQVRGGIGVFVGRPVGVWVSNSWQNSGSGLGFLQCGRATDPGLVTPVFTADASNQPSACANGNGIATGVVGPVDVMDKNLQYPQVMRANLAYDKRLEGDWFFTVEALFTKGLNNFFYINRNINYDSSYVGRNGRPMYGTIAATGVSSVYLYDTSRQFSEVIDVVNQSGDYSYNFTLQMQKRLLTSLDMSVAYTFSHSYDVQSLTSSRAISNWNFGRPGGSYDLLNTNVTRSIYDQPNKFVVSGTYTFPWKKYRTDFSMIYQGYTGQPFDYTYTGNGGRGDLNGDGNVNDLVYIPRNVFDPTEIQFSTIAPSGGKAAITPQTQQLALYNLIQSTPCLKSHQGEIMPRNACYNPWTNRFDASIIQNLPEVSGHHVTVRLDIFNLPNLLNTSWGRQRLAGVNSDVPLLTVTGMTVATNRANPQAGIPIVQFQPAFVQYPVQNNSLNYYQLQFSARFDF
jgi:hypothetical protein